MTTPAAANQRPLNELRSATERHLNANKDALAMIYRHRGWFLAAILLTLLLPFLDNHSGLVINNTAAYRLNGWEVSFMSSNGIINGVHGNVWGLNPFTLAGYGLAAYFAYLLFIARSPKRSVELYGTGIMFLAIATAPLTHVLAAQWFLTAFAADWKAQGVEWGWWVGFLASLAVWLATWANQLNAPTDEVPSATASTN